MNEQKIYKKRFKDVEKRDILWKMLTKYFFQKFIKKSDVVLDLPCGYGEFINNVVCKKKYGLDINPDCKKFLNKDITFIKGSSTKIKMKSSSVDKIFISNFFEHITREDILLTIKELKRVLKKNGKVLVLQPNIRFCAKDYWMFFDHITPIDDRALTEAFLIEGFKQDKKILRFLPYTTQSKLPTFSFLVYLYLKTPLVWNVLGKQTFMSFSVINND